MVRQGVSLALWGYKVCHAVAGHVPGKGVLSALCDNLRHKQALFKPHEVANSLQAFSDLHFQPPAALVKVCLLLSQVFTVDLPRMNMDMYYIAWLYVWRQEIWLLGCILKGKHTTWTNTALKYWDPSQAIAARAGQSIDAPSVRARSLQSLSNNSSKAILAGQVLYLLWELQLGSVNFL